jgi:tRNA-Thr(GGU) m(6)t(6)A37 methyltransferase TsaA
MKNFLLKPIGIAETPYKKLKEVPFQGMADRENTGEIVINEELIDGLKYLERFSHIIIISYLDRTDGYELLQKPRVANDIRGVFAIRSPRRPNPIGITIVKLDSINHNRIKVHGIDLLDGTPILDVKPYISDLDSV